MVWNVQKSGLEKMCVGRAGLRAYVKTQSIKLKFGLEVKPKYPFLEYNFCRNSLADWNFMTFWIFF